MKKRILISYVSYNICQETVANTLFNYFDENSNYDIKLLNLSDYHNTGIEKTSKLDFLSRLSDIKIASSSKLRIITRVFDLLKLREIFESFKPDIVISTHFYVNYITSFFSSENNTSSKIISIVTDYCFHSWWVVNKDEILYFLVSNDVIKSAFIKNGISDDKIVNFQVPVVLNNDVTRDMLVKRYNLNDVNPIFLYFGESIDDYDYFKDLAKRKYEVNIVFVCEKNIELKYKCESFIRNHDIRNVVVLSFVKDVFNIMNISDIVITRASGYNLGYAIKLRKPSILLPSSNSIERKNLSYFCDKNYAVRVSSPYSLSKKVNTFLNYPFIVKSMTNKIAKLEDNYSFEVISDLIEKISVR